DCHVDVLCRAVVIQRSKRTQVPILQRKHQIRARMIDKIKQATAVFAKLRIQQVLYRSKPPQRAGRWIVLAIGGVELKCRRGAELQLSPAAGAVKSLQPRLRIVQNIAGHDYVSATRSQATKRAAAIEFSSCLEAAAQRNDCICGGRPTIHISAKAPVLSAVVSAEADVQWMIFVCPAPGNSSCISRLT